MAEASLEIEGLQYAYAGAGGFLLRVSSLRLDRGEDVLLVGNSGEGKSTLLHLVAGLLDPEAGEVRVAGRAIHRLVGAARDRYRADHVGMIFQTHHLLHGFTAVENVMTALAFSHVPPAEHRGRARGLLDRLGIDRHDAMPDALSIGQQQRVAIARALACEPELVLADEPTASLDPESAAEAVDLLRSACRERGAALLCVSHDPTLVERFSRVATLADLAAASPAGV